MSETQRERSVLSKAVFYISSGLDHEKGEKYYSITSDNATGKNEWFTYEKCRDLVKNVNNFACRLTLVVGLRRHFVNSICPKRSRRGDRREN